MGDFIVSLVALAVSVWAILTSRRANKRSQKAQARLVAIEESRERDRVLHGRQARVRAWMESGNRGSCELIIVNDGDAAARDLQLIMDDKPLFECPALGRKGSSPPPLIGPGGRIPYPLAITASCHPPFSLKIRWQDESGIPGLYETTLDR
jgi:hypothetical protein